MTIKVVFVNGSFDVLHPGHIALLEFAKLQGDRLIVAIDSDRRIKEKKGFWRPYFGLRDREFMLSRLKAVDEVWSFDSDRELENLIKTFEPDIMVVGSDWKDKKVIGFEFAKELRFFDRDDNYSTTNILNYGLYNQTVS